MERLLLGESLGLVTVAQLHAGHVHEILRVLLVHDREIVRHAGRGTVAAEQTMSRRVERAALYLVTCGAHQPLDASQHLLRGTPCERQEEDPLGLDPALDQMRDAMHEGPRLARPCARDDQQRAVTVRRRRELRRVEIGHAGSIAPDSGGR